MCQFYLLLVSAFKFVREGGETYLVVVDRGVEHEACVGGISILSPSGTMVVCRIPSSLDICVETIMLAIL